MKRALGVLTAFALVMGVVSVALAPAASATKPDPNHRVTICHRTHSASNPYVQITVDEASLNDDSSASDHQSHNEGNGDDTGVATAIPGSTAREGGAVGSLADAAALKAAGKWWSDIIPPFYENGSTADVNWLALNWDTTGKTVFANGCKMPGEPETTHHVLTKNIPNVLEGDEEISVTFDLYVILDGTEYFVEDCTLTFGAGETQKVCTFNNLTPGFSYVIYESDTGGFAAVAPYYFTAGDDESDSTSNTVNNTFGPASAEACKVTDVKGTGYDASNDDFYFDLVLVADPSGRYTGVHVPGDVLETVSAKGGGTPSHPHCTAFTTALEDNVTYRIVEESANPWTTTGGGTDFTPQYPDNKDEVYTRTFTNSIDPAVAEACKTTVLVNAFGFTAADVYFKFTLYENGVAKESQFIGGSTPSHPTHCKTFDYVLKQGKTYTITEESKVYQKDSGPPVTYYEVTQPYWSFGAITCTLNGVGSGTSFTVSYPGDSGKLFSCSATNTRTFPAPLTPGYWKNHLTLDRGHPLAPYTAKYLPQSLGNYLVDTTGKATDVFNGMNCSSSTAQGAVGCLAGHLLATKLNLANGSDGTCISAYVTQADNFLKAIPKSPSGTLVYTGPSGNYSSMTAAARTTAIALKTKLDTFNNALGCS